MPVRLRSLTGSEEELLMVHRALSHPKRLLAYEILYAQPDAAFNDLSRRLGVKTGHAAYHLALLKAAGLVEFRYVRRSKKTSVYRLTEFGERWYRHLFGTRRLKAKRQANEQRRIRPRPPG